MGGVGFLTILLNLQIYKLNTVEVDSIAGLWEAHGLLCDK